jgi:FMN phosphatase YigB (HAD superfamily)
MQGYIFDLDGTLYNKKGLELRIVLSDMKHAPLAGCERRVRREFAGCDFGNAEAYYEAFFGRMAEIIKSPAKPAEKLRGWYFESYIPNMIALLKRHYRAEPWVEPCFEKLKTEGVPFAVYSDYPRVDDRLEAIGLDSEKCGLRFGPDDFGAQKPAERPFREIAAALGCEPSAVTVVGDRKSTDGEGARAAGMSFMPAGRRKAPLHRGTDTAQPAGL